jgi:hypothetical protein
MFRGVMSSRMHLSVSAAASRFRIRFVILCKALALYVGSPYTIHGPLHHRHQHDPQQPPKAEQNGCRQRLEGYLSNQQRLALAVA